MRLILNRPLPDETISSIVDRACSLHNISRSMLLSELCPDVNPVPADLDLDVSPPATLITNLAKALSMRRDDVEALRLSHSAWRLFPKARTVGCIRCLREDFEMKRDPYIRADWTWCFLTHCTRHRYPLTYYFDLRHAKEIVFPRMTMAHGLSVHPDLYDDTVTSSTFTESDALKFRTKMIERVWRATIRFEQKFLALVTSQVGTDSIRLWRMRNLYVLVSARWACTTKAELVEHLMPLGAPERLFAPLPYYFPSGKGLVDTWELFRSRRRICVRRAANWVVSQLKEPGRPIKLERIPEAVNSTQRQWMRKIVWQHLSEKGKVLYEKTCSARNLRECTEL